MDSRPPIQQDVHIEQYCISFWTCYGLFFDLECPFATLVNIVAFERAGNYAQMTHFVHDRWKQNLSRNQRKDVAIHFCINNNAISISSAEDSTSSIIMNSKSIYLQWKLPGPPHKVKMEVLRHNITHILRYYASIKSLNLFHKWYIWSCTISHCVFSLTWY